MLHVTGTVHLPVLESRLRSAPVRGPYTVVPGEGPRLPLVEGVLPDELEGRAVPVRGAEGGRELLQEGV